MILEVCVDSLTSLKRAKRAGANRIELCSALNLGGLTPSYGLLQEALKISDIDIAVMIRPRSGDFLYNIDEYQTMLADIKMIKELGYSTIVIGFLNEDGSIDQARLKEVIRLAHPMTIVFHRAFDYCQSMDKEIEVLIDLGVSRILTSGGKKTIAEGIDLVAKLNDKYGHLITIMPGSGLNAKNIIEIYEKSKCREFHMSGKKDLGSYMDYKKKIEDSEQEYRLEQADYQLIHEARLALDHMVNT